MALDHRALADKHLQLALRTRGLVAFFDGCCEQINPGGTAGYGGAIFDSYGERVFEFSGMLEPSPTTSNNIAEYLAVLQIFDWLLDGRQKETVRIFGDSRLVICQLWGWPILGQRLWKIHGVDVKREQEPGRYAATAVEAREKLKLLPKCKGFWIPREKNDIADDLSKAELRRRGVEFKIQPEDAA